MKRHLILFYLVLPSFLVANQNALNADIIDFENGFSDRQVFSSVTTESNIVQLFSDFGTVEIAETGGMVSAFAPNDTPIGGSPGNFFMSDGSAATPTNIYSFIFSKSISDFGFDLYDYEVSQGIATLRLFANNNYTELVAEQSFGATIDGGIITFNVDDFQMPALSALLTFSVSDPGNGIDNISFTTIPEPASMAILGLFSLLLITTRNRQYLS